MEVQRTDRSEIAERGSGAEELRVGDECFIRASTSCPRFSNLTGTITGGLEMRDYYDDFGDLQGKRLAYKVRVRGEEVCAPQEMLVKR